MADKLNKSETIKVGAFQAYIGLDGSQEDLQLPSNNYFWFKTSDVNEFDKYLRWKLLPLIVGETTFCISRLYFLVFHQKKQLITVALLLFTFVFRLLKTPIGTRDIQVIS